MRSLPTGQSNPPSDPEGSFGPGMVSGPGFPPGEQQNQQAQAPQQGQSEAPEPAQPSPPPSPPSAISKLTWIVFGAGLLLAISGGIALAVAFLKG